ncbi:hypothetical protein D9M70_465270 [compost metagenome]
MERDEILEAVEHPVVLDGGKGEIHTRQVAVVRQGLLQPPQDLAVANDLGEEILGPGEV